MSLTESEPNRSGIIIDGCTYEVEVVKRVHLNETATRIIIPTFIMNETAKDMVRVCVESIQKFTVEDVEIWLVDNNSAQSYVNWLKQFNPKINLVLNRTEPINPFRKPPGITHKLRNMLKSNQHYPQMQDGSYANAIGLELGCHCIPPSTQTIFTMHYDTLVTKRGWLRYMKSRLTEKVRAVAFRSDKIRIQALHVAGLLLDFTLFEPLQMSFLPNMRRERHPDLPEYDVGDGLTLQLRANSFDTFAIANTFNNPQFSRWIPAHHPLSQMLVCDVCFNDDREVIYMHLGRGTEKSTKKHKQTSGKVYPEQWIAFAEENLLLNTSGASS